MLVCFLDILLLNEERKPFERGFGSMKYHVWSQLTPSTRTTSQTLIRMRATSNNRLHFYITGNKNQILPFTKKGLLI